MLGNTPMMLQYQQIKQNFPDALLFFRLGDFYEMFGPDAELASKELGITLTGRDAGLESRVPMCGVPYHAVDNYLSKLIQKGFKVAICEQVEDPRFVKGIVKREVIRVITPGTVLDGQMNIDEVSNYLAALTYEQNTWGLAVCDFSTGDFWVSEFSGSNAAISLKDELNRINPAEILIAENTMQDIADLITSTTITCLNKDVFTFQNANALLLSHFCVQSLDVYGCDGLRAGVCSAGAIIYYLRETQKAPPQQIMQLKHYRSDSFLVIDATTFRNLEITRTLRLNEKKGSLLDIMNKTCTASGFRLLRMWLERPLTDRAAIEERLTAVEEMTMNWSARQSIRKHLDCIYDLERLTTRILYRRALPRELISLKNSLAAIPKIKTDLADLVNSKLLTRIMTELDTLDDIKSIIERSIVNEAPQNLNNGGVIKTGYNEEADKLRLAGENGKKWIAQLENSEKEKTGIKSLKIGYNKVFGYYFEVTKANLAFVPDYFQRKQTLANCERYITEELIALENQVLGAEEKLLSLEAKIYEEILQEIGSCANRIQKTSFILAQVDVLQSMAELAVRNDYARPVLNAKELNSLSFTELRHPVVEKLISGNSYVPNDLHIPSEVVLSIITGPNMGGKSTFCRSAALAVIMAQTGSFVPAKYAEISLRDRIFARVGASDDLGSGHSTFMVEMNEVANILRHATLYSLVILDEVGRGTSTYDGLSMAWAVSEYLAKQIKAKTLFATHYHELTRLEDLLAGIKNLSVSVREKGEEIIFLHKIIAGPADKSYGIQVGRLAGLPADVISRAKSVLSEMEKERSGQTHVRSCKNDLFLTEQQTDTKEAECIKRLRGLNLDSLTPLEALQTLYKLKNICDKEQSE